MPNWFTLRSDADGETSRPEKIAAIALAASVLFVGAMYTSARNRHASAPSKAVQPQVDKRPTNHLAGSTSPYLLQHAHNPVDWYPWGPQALSRARTENKPIFLSVGYSACHWCHVMEKEDFENENIAHIMNSNFVCIKVDREERPDIDDQYQLAVQIITGSGGWPMSVWLTPDLKPFHAGTYIPPTEFESVLSQVAKLWSDKRSWVTAQADLVVDHMRQAANMSMAKSTGGIPVDADSRAVAGILANFDKVNGGFGGKPKFPEVPRLEYLLSRYRETQRPDILLALTTTLDSMDRGGIHDQLDGGFHRYSTDAKWGVPHFEKMLYDQAQLADIYLEASDVAKRPEYRDIGTGILDFVLQDMTDPKTGGFYTSQDADSNGQEGSYYVWKRGEVEEAVGKESAAKFDTAYGVAADGNFQDDMNVLHQPKMLTSTELKVLAPLRAKLLAVRNRRIHPATDKKIVCGLNGLMIEAMASGFSVTGDKRYRAAAEKSGDFVCRTLMKPDGSLLRSALDGVAGSTPGFLEDYAYLARGMMANYKAFHDERWLTRAELVINQMNKLYWKRGDYTGFVSPGPDGSPLASRADGEDNATPSPTGIAALDLIELASLPAGSKPRPAIEVDRLKTQAKQAAAAFSAMITRAPGAFPSLLTANRQASAAPR